MPFRDFRERDREEYLPYLTPTWPYMIAFVILAASAMAIGWAYAPRKSEPQQLQSPVIATEDGR